MANHMKGSTYKANLDAGHTKAMADMRAKQAASNPLHLVPVSKGHKPDGAHGRAAVKALGRTKTTGNFKKIEKAKGEGAAIAAYQNALKAHKG